MIATAESIELALVLDFNVVVDENKFDSNKSKQTGKYTSRYKGVCFHRSNNKWKAYIAYQGKRYHLGYFETENDAAIAYNNAAIIYHKLFASLNIITYD